MKHSLLSILLLTLCLTGCSRKPEDLNYAGMGRLKSPAEKQADMKAMAESKYLDDEAAVPEIFSLSVKSSAGRGGEYDLKKALPLLKVSKTGSGLSVMLPLVIGPAVEGRNVEEVRASKRQDLAQMLEFSITALLHRHVEELTTEIRWQDDLLETGSFDMVALKAAVSAQHLSPGQPLSPSAIATCYRVGKEDGWSTLRLKRL